MVKLKNFLYGTALFVASVVALYGLKPIANGTARQVQFQGSGASGGGGDGGATNIGMGF